jgi:hypothetical protein
MDLALWLGLAEAGPKAECSLERIGWPGATLYATRKLKLRDIILEPISTLGSHMTVGFCMKNIENGAVIGSMPPRKLSTSTGQQSADRNS